MNIFSSKKHAITFLNKCNDNSLKLFQEDITDKNSSKRFIISTYDNIFKHIEQGRNNLYESWLENTKLYFAVDIDVNDDEDINEVKLLKTIILTVIKTALLEYDYKYNINDIYLTKTDKSKKKLSIHIVFRGLVFENYEACKYFYDKIMKNNKLKEIDDSIYRLTCLRMTYCSKKGKSGILKPLSVKINGEKSGAFMNKKNYFFKTLITNVNEDELTIKKKNKKTKKFDIDTNSYNITLEKLLSKLPNEYCDNYNKWIKIGLIAYNDNINNYNIFDKWSQQSKKYNEKKNKEIWDNFKNNTGKKITMGTIIYWLKENNINIKDIFSSIKYNVDNYPIKPIVISNKYNIKEINKKKLNIDDINFGINNKLFCIQSEKGTGKTTSLIKRLFESGSLNYNSILFISSRRTFGIKLLSDLEKYGFKLYSNIEEQYISVSKIIIQINSLQRLINTNYELVIIDECESLARYITSSHFMKNSNSGIITSDLEYRIKEAKNTIIMDADLSDRCVNYYKNIINIKDDNIKILKNIKTPYEDYTIKYTTYNEWVSTILSFIEKNKKLVIPMASNNKAKDLNILIKTRFQEKRILLIHKETNDNDKLKKLLNVNNEWQEYDIVIYTPTVCMGVSFDIANYFDNIFAYGCHESLGSQEFCQMIHRVREPKSKEIYISIDRYDFFDTTEDIVTYELVEELICSEHYLTKYDIHNNLIPKKFGKERVLVYPYKDDVLYDLYIRNNIEKIQDTNNFTASFFGYIKYKKYKINFLNNKSENECKQELKDISEERKNKEKELLVNNIFNAENLSNQEYKEKILRKDEYMDDETFSSIQKYNIKDCYDLNNYSEITKDFIEKYYDKKIMIHYNNLKTILNHNQQSTIEKMKILKVNEKYNLDIFNIYEEFKHKNKFMYHYYAHVLLKYIGFDINNIDNNNLKDENIIVQNINKKIENYTLKDFLEKEKKSIMFKYNLRNSKIDYNSIDKILIFINKVLKQQYGIEVKKSKNKMFQLTTNNIWNYIKRDEKIKIKKLKNNIKFDNDDKDLDI